MNPLISFIITTYNLPIEMLTACIDSILALTLRRCEREIIIVDDGSKKSPLDALKKYEEDIIYVRQSNSGLSEARNTGIRISQGTYLQFVDGDDRLLPAAYNHCLDIVRYSQPDVVMFDFTHEEKPAAGVFTDSSPISGAQLMRNNNIKGTACGYIFRRGTLSELRFHKGVYHEDEEFTPLLLLRADSVITTDAPAYLYVKRSESIITSTSMRHTLRRLSDFLQIIIGLNNVADTLPTEERMALTRRVNQLTMDYIYSVIRLTHSRRYLDRKLQVLSRNGLYPLPKRDYTRKYKLFTRLANSSSGLSILMRAIPLIPQEQ